MGNTSAEKLQLSFVGNVDFIASIASISYWSTLMKLDLFKYESWVFTLLQNKLRSVLVEKLLLWKVLYCKIKNTLLLLLLFFDLQKNSSLAGLLAIFGAFDGKEPSFGSTIVLELHRFGHVYYVRVLYFYSTDSHEAPEIITLRGCSEYCPFDQFRLLTTGMVPIRWEQECGMWKSGGSSTTMVSLIEAFSTVPCRQGHR